MVRNEKHRMIKSIEGSIDLFAGETIRKKVMESSEEITEKTNKTKITNFVKDAMERLDDMVDEETRIRIMEECGYKCAEINKRVVGAVKANRKKYKSEDEFLEAEQHKPMRGTRLIREGNVLHQFYMPQTMRMRCYCGLIRALPVDERISSTYCQCSKGFVKKLWEGTLERPVKVELIKSVVSGATECEFAIHL